MHSSIDFIKTGSLNLFELQNRIKSREITKLSPSDIECLNNFISTLSDNDKILVNHLMNISYQEAWDKYDEINYWPDA